MLPVFDYTDQVFSRTSIGIRKAKCRRTENDMWSYL